MRTVLRWIGLSLVGLVALVVILYGLRGLWGTWKVSQAKDDARSTVAHQQRDSSQVDLQVEKNRETLGKPLASWSQVVCELNTHDSGWMVDEYYQRCTLQAVDVYPADEMERARPLTDRDDRIEVAKWSDKTKAPAPLPAESDTAGFGSRAATSPQWSGKGDLEDGETYTVVTVSGPDSEPVLGCSPWGILFCTEPVDHPVVPSEDG